MIGPAQLIARSLVVGAYPDSEIRDALIDRFPEHDPDQLIDDARDWFNELDETLAAAEIDEVRRAVAAEHDTTKTMHSRRHPMDDNTLDNAGRVGRDLADQMTEKMTEVIDGFPASSVAQRVAIARICSRNLDAYADEQERG